MWNGEVKVITGIRRCGKSVLLFDLFYEYLLSQGVQEDHIIKIELDQRRYYKFRNPITLCEYVDDLVSGKKDEQFYLFIDEVQLTTKVIDNESGGIEVSIYVTRPRQHRHLKRKDSIRFLVLLVFSGFFIFTG